MHRKENHKTKIQPTEWEKIFANDATDKELNPKIYKQLIQLIIYKKKVIQSAVHLYNHITSGSHISLIHPEILKKRADSIINRTSCHIF